MPDSVEREAETDRVSLFVTCVADVIAPEVAVAAVAVLRAAGCEVEVPDAQTCCGQPAWNSGFAPEAARVARTSLEALEVDPGATVVVPAGSCATMIRLYWPQLFDVVGDHEAAERARHLGERVREVTEYLAGRELPAPRPVPCSVARHGSCHLLRELHVVDAPREVLDRVEGCSVVDWPAADECCGFGGTFSVKLPETSVAMADAKLDALPDGVTEIVGTDASCLLQLRTRAEQRGLGVTTRHVVEILARALEEPS